jgi:Fe-S cluster assembly ATP-binding protein
MSELTNTDDLGVLAITHYSRLFRELEPDRVHIMVDGRIRKSGGPELADQLEAEGYKAFGAEESPAEASASAADPFADPFADPRI